MMRVYRLEQHSSIGTCEWKQRCQKIPKWIIEWDVIVIHDIAFHTNILQSCDAHLATFANYFMPKEQK
jgi:hypothetical protein